MASIYSSDVAIKVFINTFSPLHVYMRECGADIGAGVHALNVGNDLFVSELASLFLISWNYARSPYSCIFEPPNSNMLFF